MPERFTANIKIVKVVETIAPGSGRGDDRTTSKDTELLMLTVRDTTLEGLIRKTSAHLALVEEAK
jgi:hypothetical protein